MSSLRLFISISIWLFYFVPIHLASRCDDNGTWAKVLVSAPSSLPSFILGGLIDIHDSIVDNNDRPVNDTLDYLVCDCTYQEQVLLVEAMIYAIDIINRNDSILKDIHLGYNIQSSCKIVSENMYYAFEEYSLSEIQQLNTRSAEFSDDAVRDYFLDVPVTAVIGPCDSDGATPVSNVLRSFSIPIISHAATVNELSKRSRFPNFFRTAYSDDEQTEALADLCHSFNWTYVAAVGSDDDLGREGVESFKRAITPKGLCLSSESYYDMNDESNLYAIIDTLKNKHTKEGAYVNVALLFMDWAPAQKFLKAANTMQLANMTWLGVDHWTSDVGMTFRMVDDYLPAPFTKGTVSTQFTTGYVSDFATYLQNNLRERMIQDPWLMYFYCDTCKPRFEDPPPQCTLDYALSDSCLKKVDLEGILNRQRRIPNVISAVYATAMALQNILERQKSVTQSSSDIRIRKSGNPDTEIKFNQTCSSGFCERTPIIDNDQLIDSLSTVDFTYAIGSYQSPQIKFRAEGDLVNASFDIVNFYEAQVGQCDMPAVQQQVGLWIEDQDDHSHGYQDNADDADEDSDEEDMDVSQLTLDAGEIRWQTDAGNNQPPVSYCYRNCVPGEKLVRGPSECCWKCEQCPPGWISISYNSMDCHKCPEHTYSSPNGTVCIPNTREWIGYDDTVAVVCMTLCVIGEMMTLVSASICCAMKWKSNDGGYAMKTVVFVNFALSYLYPIVIFARPTIRTCIIRMVMWQWLATANLVAKFFMLTQGRKAALRLARFLGLVPVPLKNTSSIASESSVSTVSSTSSSTFIHRWRCEICYVIVMILATIFYVTTASFIPPDILEEDLNSRQDETDVHVQSTETMLTCVPNLALSGVMILIFFALWAMNLFTSSKVYRLARKRRCTSIADRSNLTVSGQAPPRRTAVEFHASNLLWSGYMILLVLIVVVPLYATTDDAWSRNVFRVFVPYIIITLLLCVFALPRCWYAIRTVYYRRRMSRDSQEPSPFVVSNTYDLRRPKITTIMEEELNDF